MINEIKKYCQGVKSGKIPAGLHLRNAVKRFKADLESGSWDFNVDKVEKVTNFLSKLKHFTDVHAGQPFVLQPWQLFIIANIYGFYIKGTDKRRFQYVYLEMARKQGKTALMAALSLYHLIDEGEGYPEILIAANSKDQAKIGFNMCKGFSDEFEKEIPEELRRLRRHHSDINYLNPVEMETNGHDRQQTLFGEQVKAQDIKPSHKYRDRYIVGFIKNLASDSSKLDGYNCSLGIVDEYHSAKNSQVRDVIRSSMGMRSNPLLITITTAGFEKTSACYELRTLSTEIIAGHKKDDSFFSVIFSLDEEDNWKDPKTWKKSNPNLGVTVHKDFLEKQIQQAINSPSDEVGIKTKNLNIWCDSSTTWIPDDYLISSSRKLSFDDFKGHPCFVGVDLASNTDLTAVSYLFKSDEICYFITKYYLPEETLKTQLKRIHVDKKLYQQFAAGKHITITPGNVTDYDYIIRDMKEVDIICPVELVFYDSYNANEWAIKCTDQGFNLEAMSQTIGSFNIPTRTFERLILSGQVVMDDNPVTRFCFRNVDLKHDHNDNVKPVKKSDRKKIDGVISKLQALAAELNVEKSEKGINIY